jgi:hypothetical protein
MTARSSLRGERQPLSRAVGDMNAPIVAAAPVVVLVAALVAVERRRFW